MTTYTSPKFAPMATYTINADGVDLIPAPLLVLVLGLDLAALSHDGGSDASHVVEWCDRAGHAWDLPVYGRVVGTRIILWSRTDEAGVADVQVSDLTDAADDVRAYAERLWRPVSERSRRKGGR